MEEKSRETFNSSWGTILATAGVAIGLGNIWRFPYMMGRFGGATFLLIYVVVVIAFGIPALMCEWALGRYTRRGPMGAFERAHVPGGKFWGYLLLLTITMASSYYAVIIGWVLYYLVFFSLPHLNLPAQGLFDSLMGSFSTQFSYVFVCAFLCCVALYFGIKKGVEKISTAVTPLFFLLFAILIVRILTLPGATHEVSVFLSPNWHQFTAKTVLAAMGQGLFSLSLGGTFMLIYGSYMRHEENLPRGAIWTATMDAGAAIMASTIIVPAVLLFKIDMSSGPPLMFVVMPEVFERLPFGSIFAALFFLSVFLVAMLSLIGAYEVIVGAMQDAWNWSRGKALTVILISQMLLAIPSMFSVNYIFYSDLIWGSTMQPLGSVLAVVSLVWFLGRARALEEIGRGSTLPVSSGLYFWVKYVIPVGIISALIYGWFG